MMDNRLRSILKSGTAVISLSSYAGEREEGECDTPTFTELRLSLPNGTSICETHVIYGEEGFSNGIITVENDATHSSMSDGIERVFSPINSPTKFAEIFIARNMLRLRSKGINGDVLGGIPVVNL